MLKSTTKNLRIAILGASSQVGSSVAFYLRHFTEHEPICFIRSKYSSIFFEMADIKTVGVDINSTELLKTELQNVDVVLDFSMPSAEGFEMLSMIRKNIDKIISATPTHAIFIYMSSIMAYGMPAGQTKLKSYTFPRALYGYIKRKAEKYTRIYGAKYNVPVYNFRLGQVHGFTQSVSESFIDKLSSVKEAYLNGKETDLTNTIFISSLSEAIIACGLRQIKPSIYTLVSYPQWTLSELYNYYITRFSISTEIVYQPSIEDKKNLLKQLFFKKIKQYRAFIETYILTKLSGASISLKGKYRMVEIQAEITERDISYIDQNLIGKPSLPVINNLNCSVKDIWEKETAMESLYNSLLKSRYKNIDDIKEESIKINAGTSDNSNKVPELSVIIPTYKRSDSLERVLDVLKAQEEIDLEIIVVDQNPPGYFNDSLRNKLKEVIHICQHEPNASLARNTGFERSVAPYILFLDDDLIPDKDFCRIGLDAFRTYPLVKCFVPLIYSYDGEDVANNLMSRKILKVYPDNDAVFSIIDSISAAVFFERSYFQLTGGFDVFLFEFAKASEDIELFLRMRKKNMDLWFIKQIKIFHDENVAGGCELRTAGYWESRKKNARAMAYRLRSHNEIPGSFTLRNLFQILRSFVINKEVLKSGLKNIFLHVKLLLTCINESKIYYFKHKSTFKNSTMKFFNEELPVKT